MDDLEIDRTLRSTLSEKPSPEFVARVRTRLAEAPRPWTAAVWLKPAAVIACAAVALTIVGSRPEQEVAPEGTARLKAGATYSPSATYAPGAPSVLEPAFRSPQPAAKPAAKPATPLAAAGHVSTPIEPPMPEVLIAQKDIEALREFIASANEVRFTASFDETPAPTPWLITELPAAEAHNN